MGAWACGPFENDSALDWLFPLENAVTNHIRKTLSRKRLAGWEHEIIAACGLLVEQSGRYSRINISYKATYPNGRRVLVSKRGRKRIGPSFELFQTAIDRLQAIRENEIWIETWKEPRRMREALKRLQFRLARRIQEIRGSEPKIVSQRKTKTGIVTIYKNPE